MSKFTTFVLATALCLGSALAACPKGSNFGPLPDGRQYCIYCADGSLVAEINNSCRCPGGKECTVTIDGKKATYADVTKARVSYAPEAPDVSEEVADLIFDEVAESSSSSSSFSSSSSSTTTTSPEPTLSPEPAVSPEPTPSSSFPSSSELRGAAVVLFGMVAAVM